MERALRLTRSAPYVVSTRAATVHRPYQRQIRASVAALDAARV